MRIRLVPLLALGLVFASSLAIGSWRIDRMLPDDRAILDYRPPPGQAFIPIKGTPALVIDAFLSAEDAAFYKHPGIDIPLMARAAAIDLFRVASGRRPLGASTITQQMVRNLLLDDKISVSRKIKEIMLALRVERQLSKDRILEIYLNEIYLGCHAHGIAEASLDYFAKPVDKLSPGEAAFLAGLPKAPSHYNPVRFPQAAKARRNWVIDRMVENGYLDGKAAAAAKRPPVEIGSSHCAAAGQPSPAPKLSARNESLPSLAGPIPVQESP